MAEIPDEAVELAAREIHRLASSDLPWKAVWERSSEGRRNGYRKIARGMLEAAAPLVVARALEVTEERAEAILVAHQRRNIESCVCGWAELGRSHPGHQVAMLREAGRERSPEPPAGAPLMLGGRDCPDRSPHDRHWWPVPGVWAACVGAKEAP